MGQVGGEDNPGLQNAKCKWVKNRSHQGFTVHTAYGRWDIKYQPVKKLGAESFSADYEPDTYCDTGCGKKWVCEECERCEACCGCIEGECQVEDCEGTPCDECGFCDICEGGDINPCCARRTYGMRKGWGAESSSAEQVWVKNAEGNFLGPISEAEWSYLKHETEDVWEVEALTETAQWNEEDDDADDDAIAHYTTNFNNENLLAEYMTEGRKGGTSRFMDPKQVIDLFKKANGTLVSVTFVKRTNGEIRKMLARTSVRKGVKGVGLKFKPSDKNLMGVYDFGKVREGADPWKCYRFVPVDAVLTMRVRGKTYTA
jgi:hypothetical protein